MDNDLRKGSGSEFGRPHHGARYSMSSCGNVLVVVWHARPEVEDLSAIDQSAGALIRGYERIALMILIEPKGKPPTAEFKKRNAEMFKKYEQDIVAMARVIEGSSLKHTLGRLAFSTIDLMSASIIPQRTVESLASAVVWLEERDATIPFGKLEALVADLRVDISA